MAASLLGACSELDPNIGVRRTALEGDLIDAGNQEGGESDGGQVDPGGVSFALDIRPLMNRASKDPTGKGCKSCHYRTEPTHNGIDLGGLDLTTLGSLRRGGGLSGVRIVVPGKPKDSVLVQALRGTYFYAPQMPKNGPFWNSDDIEIVETWIAQGAKGADGE